MPAFRIRSFPLRSLGKSFAAGEHDEDPSDAAGFHGLLADRQSKYKDLPGSLPVRRKRAEKVPTGVISRGDCNSILFYASHSDLCSSHQAGKAGSFGERVGVMSLLILVVSLSFLLNRRPKPKALLQPKYSNSNK